MNYPNLEALIDVISALRDPINGCPWDLKQSHQSLLKYLIEESYEFVHAVEINKSKNMEEEIGDVFLQVLLHSQLGKEAGSFDIESVSKVLKDKMIFRHPHVFKDQSNNIETEDVELNWQELKNLKKEKREFHIVHEDAYAPSLKASEKIGELSREINFDWGEVSQVLEKVDEELQEVKVELQQIPNNKESVREEIGDLLFSVAQLARHLDIDPEDALKQANHKFIKRVNLVENEVRLEGKNMQEASSDELERIWQKIKKRV